MPIEHPYIFVYQTICEPNGKSYIGVHATSNLEDGYIGCGIYGQGDSTNRHYLLHRAIRKYGYTSFRRYILSFYNTYEEALEEEKYLVNKEWVKKKDNYNSALGGRGNTIEWMNEERKAEWKNNIKKKVREWMKNGGREILVNNAKNPNRKKSIRKKGYISPNRWRKVIQYDINNNIIKEHNSVKDAADYVNTTAGNIVSCCKGDYSICKGYIFRYENYNEKESLLLSEKLSRFGKPHCNSKAIKAFKINGEYVGTFESLVKASKSLNIDRNYIGHNLKGKVKYCKGYYFKYDL